MRIARKLLVVAVLAAATMAFGASSASAVTVTNTGTGLGCGTVTLTVHAVSGGCKIEAISEKETQVQANVGGGVWVTISTCEDHFEAAVGGTGSGYLYNATTSSHASGPQCTRQQCDEANMAMTKKPWALRLVSTTTMEIAFCLRNVGSPNEGALGTTCHTTIGVTTKPGGNHEFVADGTTYGACESPVPVRVIGHWNVAPTVSHPAITIAP